MLITVIPTYQTFLKAMAAKAQNLGPDHAFYEYMVKKSAFTEIQFNAFIESKLIDKRSEIHYPHLCVIMSDLPFSSSSGWADSRDIYAYLSLALRLGNPENCVLTRKQLPA